MTDEMHALIVVWPSGTKVFEFYKRDKAMSEAAVTLADGTARAVYILNTKTLVMERVKATVTTEVVA